MKREYSKVSKAFTMIEMMIVIAVIGVMSAMVISAFSGAAQDTRKVIARQQQAAVQNAVNAWVNKRSTEFDAADKQIGLIGARNEYNAASDSLARLNLVGNYLDSSTLEHLTDNSEAAKIQSGALLKTTQYLELSLWSGTSYPKVELK